LDKERRNISKDLEDLLKSTTTSQQPSTWSLWSLVNGFFLLDDKEIQNATAILGYNVMQT
jgi:hypothetical protein